MTDIRDRLLAFLKAKKIDKTELDVLIEASNGVIGKFVNGKSEIGVNKVGKILQHYPDLSAEWLMRGEGEMLLNGNIVNNGTINNGHSNINGDITVNAQAEHITLVEEVVFLRGQLVEKDNQLKQKDSFISKLLDKIK